jgi:hypothetical protein
LRYALFDVRMQANVNRPVGDEMTSPKKTRNGFWAALHALRKAIAEGIRPMTAIREFLSNVQGLIAAITILILTVTVLVLVVSKSCTPAADTTVTDTTATTTTVLDTGGPATGPSERLDGESQVTPVEGHDAHGRSARFDVFVWDQRFNWEIGQNASVELGGHPIPFGDHLAKPAIQDRMRKAQALIAVGSASQEIQTLDLEERRSDERADRLATWLEETINKPTFTLSLGRYQGSKEDGVPNTTRQRPIAIVGISACSDGVVMAEALADALYRKDRAFPFDSQKYRRFELRPATITCDRGIVR